MGSERRRRSVNGPTRATIGRRKLVRKRLPFRTPVPILPGMATNPLIALRVALPGQPSLRDLAPKVGCSYTHLNKFERGVVELSTEQLARYAKAVGIGVCEVELRWLEIALEVNLRERQAIHERMRGLGKSDPRRRAGRKSA